MQLVPIDYKEFHKKLYSYYVELFPKEERKSLRLLKKLYKRGMESFLKIVDDNRIVGFIIYCALENNPYVWLDYFAILPEYQNKGYGSKTIPILKDFFSNYDAIYGEVEKVGMGKNNQENRKRERRVLFYKKLGFIFLEDCDLNLWNVIYTPCILKIKEVEMDREEVMKNAFALYNGILGKRNVKKNGSYVIREDS